MLVKIVKDGQRLAVKKSFAQDANLLDLFKAIHEHFNVQPYEVDVLIGFPPKVITGEDETLLNSVGVVNGEALTVRNNEKKSKFFQRLQQEGFSEKICASAIQICGYDELDIAIEICHQLYVDSGSIIGKISRRVVDADNSCLFSAISFLIGDSLPPPHYRQLVANAILNDPSVYLSDMVDSSRSAEDYAAWILDPVKWGGEIEMSILSSQLRVEIAAVDIQTTIVYVYGEGKGYNKRIYLLYDGIHYDALVASTGDDNLSITHNSTTRDIKTFSPEDIETLNKIKEYAGVLKKNQKFTNLAGCLLKCNICGVGLKGQSDAVEHAKATGHQNFGQV